MAIPKLSLRGLDTVTQQRRVAESINNIIGFEFDDWRKRTAAEISAGVTPTDYSYPEGYVNRYGTNTTPGTTDMTSAVAAAINVMKSKKGAVRFLAQKYRVTSGYTNSTAGGDVTFIGEGVSLGSTTAGTEGGSSVILDSSDSSSFFYRQTALNQLTIRDMQFACAQYVADRKFFRTSANIKHVFDNMHFLNVEKPIVWESGTYFQESSYSVIRFGNSGSFHSETSSLIGTLLILDAVDIEGTFPANTEKQLMNLSGIRQIQYRNLLIEPSTPATGYVGLVLYNAHDSDWARASTMDGSGLWFEVTGSGLTYSIDQRSGRVTVRCPVNNNGVNAPFRLRDSAALELVNASFSGSGDDLQDYFSLEDYTCQVKFTGCNIRDFGTTIQTPAFSFENCSWSPSGSAPAQTATTINNYNSQLLARFDGGYLDAGHFNVGLFSSTTYTPTTDGTYGRALTIVPSSNTINMTVQAKTLSNFPQGGQFFVVLRGVAPTLSSGTFDVGFLVAGSSAGDIASYTSGQAIAVIAPITVSSANPANVGVSFNTSTATGNATIYQLEIWIGKSLPNVTLPSYPAKVITWGSAAPSAGTWVQGDQVLNTGTTAGGAPGWVCTTGGTPGTWKAMASVAA